MPTTEFSYQKIQYGCQAPILKLTLLIINRLVPIHTSDVSVKFGLDIQSETKVRVQKPKNPIWLPGSHFESDIAENQWASGHSNKQHAYEIWNWNSKANTSYTPETMSPTDRRTDRQIDRRTRWIQYTPPPPTTTNFFGRGYNYKIHISAAKTLKSIGSNNNRSATQLITAIHSQNLALQQTWQNSGWHRYHVTHPLMLVIICGKYRKNPSRTVDTTEQTWFWSSRSNYFENIGKGQRSLHVTHPLMRMMICAKCGKNASKIVDFFFQGESLKVEKVAKNWNFRILL